MNKITVNGTSIEVAGGRISINGSTIKVNGITIAKDLPEGATLKFEGDLATLESDRSITVSGNVYGDVKSGGSMQCGNIAGNAESGGSMQCGDVSGDANSGGSMRGDHFGSGPGR